MRQLLATAILATLATGSFAADNPPSFWLVEIVPGTVPAVRVIDDFDQPGACFAASLDHALSSGASFAACVPLDEWAEEQQADYMAHEYGLIDGDF